MNGYLLNVITLSIIFFTGTSRTVTLCSSLNAKPFIVVLLMVKDEAEVIQPTVETYLTKNVKDGHADTGEVAYVVLDTGSTDGTEKKLQEFFQAKGILNFHIEQEPFVDFSTSRNRALHIATTVFPESKFILFVDAEWYMNDFDRLVSYCYEHTNDNPMFCRCYNIRIIDQRPYSFCTARLIRTESCIRFKGRVHEIPDVYPVYTFPDDIFVTYDPKKQGREKSQKRWVRDKEWLLQDYQDDPKNRRTIYLLGQTCSCLQEWENAKNFFIKVTEFEEKDEFTYLAYYNLAEITEFVNYSACNKSEQDWYEALHYYLKAYSLRPHRAEPLIKIANHYLNTQDMALSYIFARRAAKLSFPSNDTLFIEKGLYDFERHRILGICAWHVGDYKTGEKAIRKALAARPGDTALEYDLSCYERRKNMQQKA